MTEKHCGARHKQIKSLANTTNSAKSNAMMNEELGPNIVMSEKPLLKCIGLAELIKQGCSR